MRSGGRDALIAVALAAFLAFVIPLQSFLGNCSLYAYGLPRLLPELAAVFLVLAAGVFVLLRLTGRFCGAYLQSFLVGALICAYLESGFLSAGIPEIDGGFIPMLSSVPRGTADAALWIVVLVACTACTRWIRPYLHWIACSVLLLGSASLLDVHADRDRQDGSPVRTEGGVSGGERVNQMTVVANVRYSPVRNVLVFVMDAMPEVVALETVRSDPALRAKFPGFTAYARNIGMHECTKRGVPGLVTGQYYDPAEMKQAEYPLTMYGSNSFLKAWCDRGAAVAFSPDLLGFGYTNLPIEKRLVHSEPRARDVLAILRRAREVPYLCLFDLVSFRIVPFALKGPILYSKIRHSVKGRHSNDSFWGEARMYPDLAAAPFASDPRPFLGVFHSWGAHPPWEKDLRTTVRDKLMRLGELMDAYRERGIYDKALIVVTCDHGHSSAPAVDGYPPVAAATLWVKPEGAKGVFGTDDHKTSHAKIAPLVRAATSRILNGAEINDILYVEDRLFRREEGFNRFKDYGEMK